MALNTFSPDQEFANPRLAELYDKLDETRQDLVPYVSLVEEFAASSVLDLGCGTGTLLSNLAEKNIDLVGVDPAEASLHLAKRKAGANKVTWILGGSEAIPSNSFDMILMTGNVAQVFLSDRDWQFTLNNVHNALSPSGIIVFETRNPDVRCWDRWDRKNTFRSSTIDGVGRVDSWCEIVDESLPLVSFKWSFVFESDGAVLTSESTIRFRDRYEVEESLSSAGYSLVDVREAADRPGKELVFIARRV